MSIELGSLSSHILSVIISDRKMGYNMLHLAWPIHERNNNIHIPGPINETGSYLPLYPPIVDAYPDPFMSFDSTALQLYTINVSSLFPHYSFKILKSSEFYLPFTAMALVYYACVNYVIT